VTTVIRRATPADAYGIARVQVETWRDTYPTILPHRYLVKHLTLGSSTASWARTLGHADGRDSTFVAVDGDAVVGFAAFGPSRERNLGFEAELYSLYVLIDAQGHGLGRRLCRAVAMDLLDVGRCSMCVEVLAANPARFFYETLKARRVATKEHPFAGVVLPTVIYGWPDLHLLAGATEA